VASLVVVADCGGDKDCTDIDTNSQESVRENAFHKKKYEV
jgi:hypothetical protein